MSRGRKSSLGKSMKENKPIELARGFRFEAVFSKPEMGKMTRDQRIKINSISSDLRLFVSNCSFQYGQDLEQRKMEISVLNPIAGGSSLFSGVRQLISPDGRVGVSIRYLAHRGKVVGEEIFLLQDVKLSIRFDYKSSGAQTFLIRGNIREWN